MTLWLAVARGQSNVQNGVRAFAEHYLSERHGIHGFTVLFGDAAKVIERGERIDSLLDKTAALKSESA